MKHTQGEWKVSRPNDTKMAYPMITTFKKATVDTKGHYASILILDDVLEDAQSKARLIAFAPKLLEICAHLQKRLEQLILLTPTGKERKALTEENIILLHTLRKITEDAE